MRESWVPIVGFPDYAVSNQGNVMNARLGHMLTPNVNSYGYLKVGLRRDGVTHHRYVHRLVAEAFAGGFTPQTRMYPHDGDWGNNEVTNIRFRKGRGLGHYRKPKNEVTIRRIRIVETGEVFPNVHDCARHIGADSSTMYKVLHGGRKSHKGLTFEYFEEEA